MASTPTKTSVLVRGAAVLVRPRHVFEGVEDQLASITTYELTDAGLTCFEAHVDAVKGRIEWMEE